MEQTNSMVEQIGRVVANELLKNRAVYLPSIGSLYVDTLPSQIASSGGEISPPRCVVKYSEEAKCGSFVDVLTRVGSCDKATAENIYERWLDKVKTPQGADITAVGSIVNGRFKIASTLDGALNPEQWAKLRLKKRNGRWGWIAASVLCCVVVGLLVNFSTQWFLGDDSDDVEHQLVVETVEASHALLPEKTEEVTTVVDTTKVVEVAEVVDSVNLDEQQVAPAVRLESTPAPEVNDNPIYRVVFGVFSTMENAQSAAEEAYKLNIDVTTKIRPFGDKFMVNVFESDQIEECKSFMANNRVAYPDAWISKRRVE